MARDAESLDDVDRVLEVQLFNVYAIDTRDHVLAALGRKPARCAREGSGSARPAGLPSHPVASRVASHGNNQPDPRLLIEQGIAVRTGA